MVNLNNLFLRIKELGINAKKLSDDTGISSGNISDWKSGRSMPSAVRLDILADYLDCSVDYLLGRTDEITSEKPDRHFYQLLFTKYGLKKMREYLRSIIENYGIERLADELNLEIDDIKRFLLNDDTLEYGYKCWDRFSDVLIMLETNAYNIIHSIAINENNIIELYNNLDDEDKAVARHTMVELLKSEKYNNTKEEDYIEHFEIAAKGGTIMQDNDETETTL